MARLTTGSIEQLFAVLESTRRAHARGVPMPRAYQDAVRDVARHHSVTYQTIGDLRRRLGFADVHEYHDLIQRWLHGDSAPLRQRVTEHAEVTDHSRIRQFFDQMPESNGRGHPDQGAAVAQALSRERNSTPALEELRLRVSPETKKRVHLAHLAKLGDTVEEAAVVLLERGFDVEKDRIKNFLERL